MQLLQQFQNGLYKDISLVNVMYLRESGKEPSVIILSASHLIHLMLQPKKCLWTVPLQIVRQVRLREEFKAVQLTLVEDVDGLPNRNPIILLGDDRQARSLYQSIEETTRNLRLSV